MSERKIVKSQMSATPNNDFGLGVVSAEFEAERYPGTPLLDTKVTLNVSAFSITWNDREKLLRELQAVIDKYQI